MAVTSAVGARPTAATGRIVGIDVARAIAMLGMVIAHYVWTDGSGHPIEWVAIATDGRAMPLFVMLGGIGVTILTARSAVPDRALLIRAAILYPTGVVLQELTTFIAIILQSYAFFFVVAVGARRLPDRVLLGTSVAVALVGGWTYQVVGPRLPELTEVSQLVTDPQAQLWSLLVNGFYPFFPVGSFFLFGMWLGRRDLRARSTPLVLTVVGAAVGLGSLIVGWLAFESSTTSADPPGSTFSWLRLLDTAGHSEMPLWVLSAGATSVAVIGVALLAAPRFGTALIPLVALGQLALTFYVFQAVLVRAVPHPTTTPLDQELVTAVAIYVTFMVFAIGWRSQFRTGPLEAVLRIGTRARRSKVTSGRQG